jgi:hypothetical protein
MADERQPAFDASIFRLTPGQWKYDHPVDFIVTSGKRGPSVVDSDTELSATYTAGRVYDSIATSDALGKQWIRYPGGPFDLGYLERVVAAALARPPHGR